MLNGCVCLTYHLTLFSFSAIFVFMFLMFLMSGVSAKPTHRLAAEANYVRNVDEDVAFLDTTTNVTINGSVEVTAITDSDISYFNPTQSTNNGRRRPSDDGTVSAEEATELRQCLADAESKARKALQNYVSRPKSERKCPGCTQAAIS